MDADLFFWDAEGRGFARIYLPLFFCAGGGWRLCEVEWDGGQGRKCLFQIGIVGIKSEVININGTNILLITPDSQIKF